VDRLLPLDHEVPIQEIVSTLSKQLSTEFGSSNSRLNRFRMIRFAECLPEGLQDHRASSKSWQMAENEDFRRFTAI
jgi:hypothetical protein